MDLQRYERNKQLAQSLKGGVIMDVTNPEQAKIAEAAGAVAVMALERVPSDIRKQGGVARMSDPKMIKGIQQAVSIPVMAKARIGHIAEAQILEALGIDYIDESEVLTPADDAYHLNKFDFKVPFVCGARNIGEALRRIGEGASMIRTKGEAGTGNVVEAVRHMRTVMADIRRLQNMPAEELMTFAKDNGAPYDLVVEVAKTGKLPVVNFAAGGIATPCRRRLDDAAGQRRHLCGQRHLQVLQPGKDGPGPLSRPPLTTTTRMCWPKSVKDWEKPCVALSFPKLLRKTGWPSGAGNRKVSKLTFPTPPLPPKDERRHFASQKPGELAWFCHRGKQEGKKLPTKHKFPFQT